MTTVRMLQAAAGATILTTMGTFGSAASAGTVPWANASGSAATFTYSEGFNATGLFGNPLVSPAGDFFLFFPAGFSASAFNTEGGASSGSATDRLQAVITAAPGRSITSVSTTVVGDYSTLRGGTVDATALLSVKPTGGTTLSSAVDFGSINSLGQAAIFSGNAFIGLPANVETALISLDASLLATAGAGGTGFIQFKGVNLSVATAPIDTPPPATVPLPAAALAMPIAGAVAYAASRKRKK